MENQEKKKRNNRDFLINLKMNNILSLYLRYVMQM